MIAGIDGLSDELRVLRQPVVAALLGEARRLVAKHDDNLVFHIEAGIVVVVELVGGDAISRKHEGRRHLARGGKTERNEVLIDLQIVLRLGRLGHEAVVGLETRPRDDGEGLGVAVHSRGLNPEFFVALFDQMFGARQSLGARAAAFHFRRGQRLDVAEIPCRIRLLHRSRCGSKK